MEALALPQTRRPPTRIRPLAPGSTPQAFDRAYWLAHCDGYRVDGANGKRLGFVEETRLTEDGRLAELVVRGGRLGMRVVRVPAADVAFVVPRTERIWLRTPAGR